MAKGFKTGGRQKGTPNRSTVERQVSSQMEISRAARAGVLGKEVLERLAKIAEGIAAAQQPKLIGQDARGQPVFEGGNWALFGEWFDRTAYCAKELMKYQNAPIKAVDAPTPPPDPREVEARSRKRFGLRVFDGGRPLQPIEADDDAEVA